MYKAIDREPIWAALAALFAPLAIANGGIFQTIGRQHVRPPTLTDDQQPALFVVQQRETTKPGPRGLPGKVTLTGFLVVYFVAPMPLLEPTGAETILGSTMLNAFLLAINQAIAPTSLDPQTMQPVQTLGGLVSHCWIEGDTDMDTGVFTQQGAAIVPVKILIP